MSSVDLLDDMLTTLKLDPDQDVKLNVQIKFIHTHILRSNVPEESQEQERVG